MKPSELQVSHHFVDLPKLRMHYVEKGSGPLVILLHGFPESWWSWRYQIDAIAAAGFRVVVPDQRGYGETDKHGPYDLDTLAADITHLIEALGPDRRVRIVGHDWGGAVAWHLASHFPEFCSRLTVLNCPHPALMRRAFIENLSPRQLAKSWYMFFFQLPWLPEWVLTKNDAEVILRMLKASSRDRSHFGDDDVRPFREAIQRPGAASGMVGWYRASIRAGFAKPFTPPKYPPITCETLLIWGKADPALDFNEVVPGTDALAPKLRIHPIEDCGHFVQSERPDAVNPALLEFLSAQ